ncbi:Na+/H+ antiporter [Methylorubrum extorquens]|uniref:Na+/H+ antiporter n=1 Tax=Methylorubrum extorquens TaxID=408 RepID=A0A1S1P746_METEX|nr:Na+/H+ antiporter [Methylorubrum extorquens]
MSPVETFEFILLLMVAALGLQILATLTKLPPAAALIVGGIGLAFVPGIPELRLDPDLVLVIFLPPLLLDGAYFTVWSDFRRHLTGILALAVGAVAFTTLVVGIVTHWLVPDLPWAVCFALGAVVSPPDAVSAKAVLARVTLPRRLTALLEGESLLNDATGLVLVRFAVTAALTGTFSAPEAFATFGQLALGGILIGGLVGAVWIALLRLLTDTHLIIASSFLLSWAAYIAGESLHVSGVIATVVAGLMFGWCQHEIFSASVRVRGTATWKVMVFLMEALVFVLIGLSLRSIVDRLGGTEEAIRSLALPVAGIVAAVVLSRLAWVFASDAIEFGVRRLLRKGGMAWSPASSLVLSWAGMRGVVTLAIALALPDSLPGRDLILAAAAGVILVTVLIQGATLAPLIRFLRLKNTETPESRLLTLSSAHARIAAVQLAKVESLSGEEMGTIRHHGLLEQYRSRAAAAVRLRHGPGTSAGNRDDRLKVLLAAVAAGRAEVLRLHRSGMIRDETLQVLEHDLDLQEVAALNGSAG